MRGIPKDYGKSKEVFKSKGEDGKALPSLLSSGYTQLCILRAVSLIT